MPITDIRPRFIMDNHNNLNNPNNLNDLNNLDNHHQLLDNMDFMDQVLEEVINLHGDDDMNESDTIEGDETDEEEQEFDITLAASHSYMGSGLAEVRGRGVVEAGWAGRVLARAHGAVVFPGETVPMRVDDARDAALLADVIRADALFGLLCPDGSCRALSGYGVLCEVLEAELEGGAGAGAGVGVGVGGRGAAPDAVTFKARAVHRCRLRALPARPPPISQHTRLQYYEVVALPEPAPIPPLLHARLACLDPLRPPPHLPQDKVWVQRMDAALTPWPAFVLGLADCGRLRARVLEHFRELGLERLMPSDAVSLSYWAASNASVSPRDRAALLAAGTAAERLRLAAGAAGRAGAGTLACAACGGDVARRGDEVAMSSAGPHAHYTNPGGHTHDLVTVRAARATLTGPREAHYSWFPGYAWTIAVCTDCSAHVGWRFDALRSNLRPQRFYGLSRNAVHPRASTSTSTGDEAPPRLDRLDSTSTSTDDEATPASRLDRLRQNIQRRLRGSFD